MSGKPSSNLKWVLVALLVGFSVISYVERVNLSVIGKFIAQEYDFDLDQIGSILGYFLLSYTIFQIPSGFIVDKIGSARILFYCGALWFVATIAIGVFGSIGLSAEHYLLILICLRIFLGVIESPTYPAINASIASMFQEGRRGLPVSLVQAASYFGSAVTMPVMAFAVVSLGWRNAVYVSAVPALVLAIIWRIYASRLDSFTRTETNTTQQPDTAKENTKENISGGQSVIGFNKNATLLNILTNRNLASVSFSYFGNGFCSYLFFFWFFIYLVDERNYSVANGGIVAALPIIFAGSAAVLGGKLDDMLNQHWGRFKSSTSLILFGNIVGATALLIGAFSETPVFVLSGFIIAAATRGFVETSHWSLAMTIGGRRVGTAGGVMNTYINLGGFASTMLAPIIVRAFGWPWTFALASLVLLICAGQLWAALRSQT